MAYTTVGVNSEAVRFGFGALEYHVVSFDESRSSAPHVGNGGCGRCVPVRGWRGEIERERVRT
jgi:hypothetical protein